MILYDKISLAPGYSPAAGDNTNSLVTSAWVKAGFMPNDGSYEPGVSINLQGNVTCSKVIPAVLQLPYYATGDANYSFTGAYSGIVLQQITANRVFTLPPSGLGTLFLIANTNTSAFTWTLAIPILDGRGNTITIFPNNTTMYLWYDGTNWRAFSTTNQRARFIASVAFSATITPSFATTDISQLSLTGNTTIAVPTGIEAGSTVMLQINQTGNFVVTWSGYKIQGGFILQNSKGAGKIDIYYIFYDGVNYYLNAYNLNATAPAKTRYGNMSYKKTYWTALTDFTQVGSVTPTIVNGAIRFAGGTNDYNNYLTINSSQNADQNMDLEITYRIVTVPAANSLTGIGIGRTSINAFNKVSTAVIDLIGYTQAMTVATDHAIAGNISSATYGTMPAVGDVCRIKYAQRGNLIFGIYHNITKGLKNTFNYFAQFTLGAAYVQLPNMSNVAIYNVGGSVDILGIEASSQTTANPYIIAIGDSKTMGYGSIAPAVSWVNSINQLGPVAVWAGGADNTAEILAGIPNAIKLNPQYAILNAGRNDIANSVAAATYQANYQSIVSALNNAGITVIHLTPIPETGISQTALDTWIRATYPGQFIDTSVGWVNATHLGSDGVHPSADGHRLLSNIIVNSGLVPASGIMVRGQAPFDASFNIGYM